MEAELLKAAASQGFFAVASVCLIVYVLKNQEKRDKKSEERERRLMDTIDKAQANNLQLANAVQQLTDRVEAVDRKIDKLGGTNKSW